MRDANDLFAFATKICVDQIDVNYSGRVAVFVIKCQCYCVNEVCLLTE